MGRTAPRSITKLLIDWSKGDAEALNKLTPLVYARLRRLAKHFMANERPGHPLQATALVHEVYIKLIGGKNIEWQSRGHFYRVVATVMRRVLVDIAKARNAIKRSGPYHRVSIDHVAIVSREKIDDIVAIDEALQLLEKDYPRAARVVELQYFGGLAVQEVADILEVSDQTVRNDWRFACAWINRQMTRESRHDASTTRESSKDS